MKKAVFVILAILTGFTSSMMAQETKNPYLPEIHGTIRAKYEYEPTIGKGRFEIRNARMSVEGKIIPIVRYKAEIDLSDEGAIKMLDAYVRLQPKERLKFTFGQMRVPFSIDAHRSPHLQYFANRSFIAKQVGNVRDVGAAASWTFGSEAPFTLEGGIFNGSGLTNQKNFWTSNYNFSFKSQICPMAAVQYRAKLPESRCRGCQHIYVQRWCLLGKFPLAHRGGVSAKVLFASCFQSGQCRGCVCGISTAIKKK